jgi:integrase
MDPRTRTVTRQALDHFERIINPKRVLRIKTQTIDDYIAKRRQEPGRRKGDLVSPATVNKELRHLRAVLRIAHDWGYLPTMPRFRMLREPVELPTHVTPEHFAKIYEACDQARMPEGMPFSPADWWRALLVMDYMTGWRIGELLALPKEDLDLEAGTAVTRHEDNKGKRDERIKRHPVVMEHLRKLTHFGPKVFPWNHHERTLYDEYARIQEAAGIHLPCRAEHEHTRLCHVYGFHDGRRAFATMNADKLSADALQPLMRYKSYATTQKYINMARQMDDAVKVLHVPEVLRNTGN